MRKSLLSVMVLLTGCSTPSRAQPPTPSTRPYVVGHLQAEALRESSGIVESRRYPRVFWSHNDSGNAPVLYAIRLDGTLINAFRTKAVALDWEDIAIDDEGHLYVGDIGNNGNLRGSIGVLQFDEPDPNLLPAEPLEPTKRWTLTFHDGKRMDSESLFVWKGNGYLVRKSAEPGGSTLWSFSLPQGKTQPLKYVATLPVQALCTGADISADGDMLAVLSVNGPYLFRGLRGDLTRIASLEPKFVPIRPGSNEAVCFTSDGLVATSEGRDVYHFPFKAFDAPTTRPADH